MQVRHGVTSLGVANGAAEIPARDDLGSHEVDSLCLLVVRHLPKSSSHGGALSFRGTDSFAYPDRPFRRDGQASS
jgi:hypothetical protein